MNAGKFERWMLRGNGTVRRLKQASFGILPLVFAYCASYASDKDWLSYISVLPALAVLATTALFRLIDIKGWALHQAIRRCGFLLIVAYAAAVTVGPFTYLHTFPTWTAVIGVWGFTCCWMTTPNMPPWWKWVSGQYKYKDPRMV